MPEISQDNLRETVHRVVDETPVTDVHTHIYDPALGSVLLWGIDELVTYHYLVAEIFRARPDLGYDAFWAMSKKEQADLIWSELFVKRSPVSESCRGVLTVLDKLGLDGNTEDLTEIRAWFAEQTVEGYVDKVFELANVEKVYMTNDPMDAEEGPGWEADFERDARFLGVLRVDSVLIGWPDGAAKLKARGYDVDTSLSGKTLAEVRRYLNDWCDRLDARYMAISLPPDFRYPATDSSVTTLMTKAVYPVAAERGIPSAMMIGVKKLVNPALRLAGDGVGKGSIETLEAICRDFPDVKFLITMLARENTHELCVAARKFKNMVPFGCWWFLNDPSLIREITAMRLELLGLTFVPQHSDARVLDQLIYKWTHSRALIADVLTEKYDDMLRTGRTLSEAQLRRDVGILFDGRLVERC